MTTEELSNKFTEFYNNSNAIIEEASYDMPKIETLKVTLMFGGYLDILSSTMDSVESNNLPVDSVGFYTAILTYIQLIDSYDNDNKVVRKVKKSLKDVAREFLIEIKPTIKFN